MYSAQLRYLRGGYITKWGEGGGEIAAGRGEEARREGRLDLHVMGHNLGLPRAHGLQIRRLPRAHGLAPDLA